MATPTRLSKIEKRRAGNASGYTMGIEGGASSSREVFSMPVSFRNSAKESENDLAKRYQRDHRPRQQSFVSVETPETGANHASKGQTGGEKTAKRSWKLQRGESIGYGTGLLNFLSR